MLHFAFSSSYLLLRRSPNRDPLRSSYIIAQFIPSVVSSCGGRGRIVSGPDQEPGGAGPQLSHVCVRCCSCCPRVNVPEALACAHESSFSDSRWCQALGRWRSRNAERGEQLAPGLVVCTRSLLFVEAPLIIFHGTTVSSIHCSFVLLVSSIHGSFVVVVSSIHGSFVFVVSSIHSSFVIVARVRGEPCSLRARVVVQPLVCSLRT